MDDLEQLKAQIAALQASPQAAPLPTSGPALPNGGLEGAALAQYIKANPGPQAMVGNNPANPTPAPMAAAPAPESDDSDEEATPARSPAAILSKLQSLKASPTQNPPPVQDVLSKLLGQSQDQMQDAKSQRDKLQLFATLGQAGSTIGQALTPLAPKQDYSKFYDMLQKQAEMPISDLSTQQALQQGALKTQMLKGQTATEMNQSDPNSDVSKVMRDLYKQETGKEAPAGMAYAEIAKLEPSLARMANAKQMIAMRMDALKTRGEEKQANALKDTQNMIETARGAKDVQNARETARLIDNAQSLLAEYPDLNKMPAAQISLFAQELGKIAKGGVAGEAEVKDIMPGSIASKLMKGLGQIENKPEGAQLAAFLQEYQPYLNTIKTNSNKLVSERTERILKVQTPRLGLENVKLMRGVYNLQPSAAPAAAAPTPIKQFDADVMDYAQKHNISPEQANQIKVQRMGQ